MEAEIWKMFFSGALLIIGFQHSWVGSFHVVRLRTLTMLSYEKDHLNQQEGPAYCSAMLDLF